MQVISMMRVAKRILAIPTVAPLRELKKRLDYYIAFKNFQRMAEKTNNRFALSAADAFPCLNDATDVPAFGEYFFHLAWAARKIRDITPEKVYDFSSHTHFAGILSAFFPVVYHEFRHVEVRLDKLHTKSADLCALTDIDNNCLSCVTCMHVIEHIGLGRYGDPLDYDADIKALEELKRIVAVGGDILLVIPVGNPARIEFNAHRIYDVAGVLASFSAGFSLEELSVCVHRPEGWQLKLHVAAQEVANEHYAVACLHLKKINLGKL